MFNVLLIVSGILVYILLGIDYKVWALSPFAISDAEFTIRIISQTHISEGS